MAIFKKILYEIYIIFLDFKLIFISLFKKKLNNESFLILTGSDSTHFNSLINLLISLVKYEKLTEIKIIDLGMTLTEINFLKSNFKIEISKFDFKEYPKFINIRDSNDKLGAYAWKPISIYNEFCKSDKNIIWLDAGCKITKKLKLIKYLVLKNGFYSPQSSNNILRWTHPTTLAYLKVNKDIYNKRNISGGIVSFAKNSEEIQNLLTDWYKFSLNEEIISPKGSNRENHRQDQAVLSILVHKYSLSKITPKTHKIFGILKHQDNEEVRYIEEV